MSARDVARRVVRRTDSADAFATLALSAEIERANLDRRDAALATELTLGVLRHRRRLDVAVAAASKKGSVKVSSKIRAIIRVAAYEILFCDGIPAHASVNEAAKATRSVAGSKLAGFVNALLRRLVDSGEPPLPEDARERLGVEHSLPAWLVDEIADALGNDDELAAAAAAMSAVPPVCLRPNRLRTTRSELLEGLHEEVLDAEVKTHPLAAAAIVTRRLGAPSRLPSFREGLFTVQDAAAQRVLELIDPRGVESILDACAGVGGKTTHLAELFGDAVPICAVDIAAGKLELLRESAKRLGLASIRQTLAADLTVESPTEDTYDLVVLDAPCSGFGVLRRHPEAKWRLGPGHSAKLASVQSALLDACEKRVATGGQLLYAVCTFPDREGAGQVRRFLERHPGFELSGELSIWPHRDEADGFYAARLVRRA